MGWRAGGTEELAIVMEDSDTPLPGPFVHLMVYGIPGESNGVAAGALAEGGT
jgi:phosphatidylethanolamine-binding protein (PEBP) family uncharacterized protein